MGYARFGVRIKSNLPKRNVDLPVSVGVNKRKYCRTTIRSAAIRYQDESSKLFIHVTQVVWLPTRRRHQETRI
jgi:hypothetical protein